MDVAALGATGDVGRQVCTKLIERRVLPTSSRLQLVWRPDGKSARSTHGLLATLEAWWPAIEVLIITGVTNARTEAANTTIKNIKRTGRGFRNAQNYRTRILLVSAARSAA